MKIKVTYIEDKDPYKELYSMSKDELIKIIKQNDKNIDYWMNK